MGEMISSVRPVAYTVASPPNCIPPQAAAEVQGEAPAPPEAASRMTEWMSMTPVPAKRKAASWKRKATLSKHHGGKENIQPPRPRPPTARVEEGIAHRGIYPATVSLGAPQGDWDLSSPPLWRSANAGSKTKKPATSDPVSSSSPAAPRQPTATPSPQAAFPTWSQVFESCREWCGGLTL